MGRGGDVSGWGFPRRRPQRRFHMQVIIKEVLPGGIRIRVVGQGRGGSQQEWLVLWGAVSPP